ENYPKKRREKILELKICRNDLEGELDLGDFVNLEILDCCNNKLSTIDVSKCVAKKHFPEMALINISDIDEIAEQLNKQTANDPDFLKKTFKISEKEAQRTKGDFFLMYSELVSRIVARCCIIENRFCEGKDESFPLGKAMEGKRVLTIPNRKELINRVLNGDWQLIEKGGGPFQAKKEKALGAEAIVPIAKAFKKLSGTHCDKKNNMKKPQKKYTILGGVAVNSQQLAERFFRQKKKLRETGQGLRNYRLTETKTSTIQKGNLRPHSALAYCNKCQGLGGPDLLGSQCQSCHNGEYEIKTETITSAIKRAMTAQERKAKQRNSQKIQNQ
ncbi:10871_t:CDS:2, partial [Racocetra fulgida]